MSHVAPHRWADALAGKLDEAELAAIEQHAAGCPACALARTRVARASQTFPALRGEAAPELGWDTIRARVHWSVSTERRARSTREQHTWLPSRRTSLAIALGAMLAGGVAVGIIVARGTPAREPTRVAPVAVHSPIAPKAPAILTGLVSRVAGDVMIDGVRPANNDAFARTIGAGTVLATGDGRIDVQFGEASAFALGPRSTLEVRSFDAGTIELAVEGTIDLEVAPRAKDQRFVVIAGDRTVEVRGTQFRVTHDRAGTRVACRHGLVAVRDTRGETLVGTARKLDVLPDALLADIHAVPLSADELGQLVKATPWTTPGWIDSDHVARGSAPLEIATIGMREVRVDGIELGEAPLQMRVMPGRHTIEEADRAGRFHRAGWVDVGVAHAARFDAAPIETIDAPVVPTGGVAQRKKQLAAGIDRARLERCTRAMAKQGLTDTYVEIEISVDAAGAVNFLNVIDSDVGSATSSCVHDVLADVRFAAGVAATWREKLAL